MADKNEGLVRTLIPEPLEQLLYKGRFMTIGDSVFMASVKLSELSTVPGQDNSYELDFKKIGIEFVKGIYSSQSEPKAAIVRKLFTDYNFSAEYPIPCNLKDQYKFRVHGEIWNSYNYPIWDWKPVKDNEDVENKCKHTLQLFRHIYGEQIEIGLDVMTVEFMFPTHPLPAQIYFSRENKTAKSTMLYYKRQLYGSNAVIIDNNTFEDKFNAPLAGKVFIGIDEGTIKKEGGVDKIKNMITAPNMQLRAMHQAATEIPNYSKWAVATNNDMFASIDQEDSRFWVIHVPKLKSEYDPEFKNKLRSEIPYWIGFLKKRWELRMDGSVSGILKMKNPYPKDRLWLMEEQYCTDALIELKRKSIPITAKNILDALIEWFDKYNDKCLEFGHETIYEIRANVTQVKESLFEKDNAMNSTVIKNAIEKYLNISPTKESLGYKNHLGFDFKVGFVASTQFVNRRNTYKLDYYDLVFKRDGVRINRDKDFKQGDLFKK